jgi:hypothetical protein
MSVAAIGSAQAQADPTRWGVSVSFVPDWKVPPKVGALLLDDAETNLYGSELRIGIMRGRDEGGDWGVSYVNKAFGNEAGISESSGCFPFTGNPAGACAPTGSVYDFSDVRLTGVEIHKFTPFGTIGRRVQIGLEFAGGVASIKGTAHGVVFGVEGSRADEPQARDLFIAKLMPLVRLEAVVAVIVAPGLKVRVHGGINSPGYQVVGITASYGFF